MIIEALLGLMSGLLDMLTAPFDIPLLPPEVYAILQTVLDYLAVGFAILANYTHLDYLFILFGIVLAFDVGIFGYKFVMWILRKIPILGID